MPIYLDEDQIGTDATVIGYPHLVLCMGVTVVMDDGHLIGAHVSSKSSEDQVLIGLTQAIAKHGGQMRQLYCCGNLAEHITKVGCLDTDGKAAALGFHGTAHTFDTGFIKPKDGTYVELTSRGADAKCVIRFKRNEKVAFTTGTGAPAVKSTVDFFGKPKQYQINTNFVSAVASDKTLLGVTVGHHTMSVADYAVRIKTHTVA
jgi:hypothetical protein